MGGIGILRLYPAPELRQQRTEVVEGIGVIAVAGIAHSCKGARQRDGGHIKRATMGGGLAWIHKLDAAGTVVGPRGIEVDLQVADGFQHGPYLQVIGAVDGSRCGDTVVFHQPPVFQGLVDIAVANHTKGKIKTW